MDYIFELSMIKDAKNNIIYSNAGNAAFHLPKANKLAFFHISRHSQFYLTWEHYNALEYSGREGVTNQKNKKINVKMKSCCWCFFTSMITTTFL